MLELIATFWKAVIDTIAVVLSATALFFAIYTWWSTRKRATKQEVMDEIQTIDMDVRTLNVRTTRIEERLEHLPGREDIEKVHARISDVRKTQSELSSDVAGLKKAVDGLANGIKTIQTSVQQLVENELAEARDAKNRGK